MDDCGWNQCGGNGVESDERKGGGVGGKVRTIKIFILVKIVKWHESGFNLDDLIEHYSSRLGF